ncbi:hypothetical protein MYX84_04085 [Acidobacteria bacterium AH-259-O06]|nr:hypothetical protein [Acidobacteria bacterium AH-259-O06]
MAKESGLSVKAIRAYHLDKLFVIQLKDIVGRNGFQVEKSEANRSLVGAKGILNM